MEDQSLNQSLNIGTEVQLFEGCTKHVRIGSIKLIREIRQLMKDTKYKFSFCIGRTEVGIPGESIDISQYEKNYLVAFRMVLVEGLTDEEYDNVDEDGIKELDNLLDRFL